MRRPAPRFVKAAGDPEITGAGPAIADALNPAGAWLVSKDGADLGETVRRDRSLPLGGADALARPARAEGEL